MTRRRKAWPAATRQILVWGCLWGVVVTAAEGVVIQDTDASFLHALQFWVLHWGLPLWCAVGCLYLVVARRALRHDGWWPLVPGWLVVSVSWAAIQPWVYLLSQAVGGPMPMIGTVRERIVYNLWPCLFFGGILVAAYALAVRTERTRSLLQDAAIARSRTTALRGQMALAALQRHVDPTLLLNVMGEVERRYRDAPDQADDLLGRLVDFLRCAMPGLKDDGSTLEAELQLALAYVRLQSARRDGAGWTIEQPADLPSLAFPSQLVLPLLALAEPGSAPRLSVRRLDSAVTIEVQGLGRLLPDDFVQQARMRLQWLLGDSFSLQVPTVLHPQLALTLGLSATGGDPHAR